MTKTETAPAVAPCITVFIHLRNLRTEATDSTFMFSVYELRLLTSTASSRQSFELIFQLHYRSEIALYAANTELKKKFNMRLCTHTERCILVQFAAHRYTRYRQFCQGLGSKILLQWTPN